MSGSLAPTLQVGQRVGVAVGMATIVAVRRKKKYARRYLVRGDGDAVAGNTIPAGVGAVGWRRRDQLRPEAGG